LVWLYAVAVMLLSLSAVIVSYDKNAL